MASIVLYYAAPSPPCRSVLMLAKALGVKLNLKKIDIMAGEHMTPEFLKMNPQHTIPTLDDGGFILWESRAIMKYLVDKYAKDESFFPSDPQQAAIVNQRLYFDAGTLYQRLFDYFFPVVAAGVQPDEIKAAKFEEALKLLDGFLQNETWVAGSQMTIADFCIITTISTAEACMIDISKYPHISAWYQRTKKAMNDYEYMEIDQAGADILGGLFRSKVK